MWDWISRINPFVLFGERKIIEMEKVKIAKLETKASVLDRSIEVRKQRYRETAESLEKTVNEALERFKDNG